MKVKKLSRVVAAVVLSAALMMEPYAGITAVHAEGTQTNENDEREKQAGAADLGIESSDESMESEN